MKAPARPRRGFLLGKFMPPHNGHVLLCGFAQELVEELTILVCTLPSEPMPGELRLAWMRELNPRARVLWCSEVLPQQPADDPENFWAIWRDVVVRHHPEPIDLVFASEDYGARLAQELGADFAPCDRARRGVPISASAIRADPFGNWAHIPACVRPHYVKRVCVTGPESSGKTTLAVALARRFATALAPEYGRTYTEHFGVRLNAGDLVKIAQGQRAIGYAAMRLANRVLIEDTDPLLTAVWSEMLLGERAPSLEAYDDYADLYLLCDIDFAWADDGTRYFADAGTRQLFFAKCRDELERREVRYIVVAGSHEDREAKASAEIEVLLGAPT